MSWPKGRPRPKKVGSEQTSISPQAVDEILNMGAELDAEAVRAPNEPPADWRKGMLLNVRNYGDAYVITLYPEEFRAEHPERALRFTNPGECQDFVSAWYSNQHHDPRAR